MKISGLLATTLAAVLLPSTSVANAGLCDTITVRSYKVGVDVEDSVYRIGRKATIHLTVTRKNTGDAVSGALAAVMIPGKRDSAVFGIDETDDRGRALLKVYLSKRYIEPGPVGLQAYAYMRQVDTACATVSEYGYKRVPRAFRVKP